MERDHLQSEPILMFHKRVVTFLEPGVEQSRRAQHGALMEGAHDLTRVRSFDGSEIPSRRPRIPFRQDLSKLREQG